MDIIDEMMIHFLFTDIQMPGINNGLDLAKEVAARFPEAGIIVASDRVSPDEIDLPASAGFFGKPCDLSTIRRAL
jgi:DNA-binding NarL/FixJ family response regulator